MYVYSIKIKKREEEHPLFLYLRMHNLLFAIFTAYIWTNNFQLGLN